MVPGRPVAAGAYGHRTVGTGPRPGFPKLPSVSVPLPLPVSPLDPARPPRSGRELYAALERIDGWGPLAWREVYGAWRLGRSILVLEPRELGPGRQAEAMAFLILPDRLGRREPVATCDWLLRRAWRRLLAACPIEAACVRPGQAVRPSNGCFPLADGRPCLRLELTWPQAGAGLDAGRFAAFVRACAVFARDLRPDASLARFRRVVARQRALRSALPGLGLCAFLGEGSLPARDRAGKAASGCIPLRPPPGWRRTIDLGVLGRVRGLAIPAGITVLLGAPYHGKSTLLQAVLAGSEDHPPGDGRELVVSLEGAVALRAEEGRPIKEQDLSPFWPHLPGGSARSFSTARASGATSMASTLLQSLAAGSRLLVVDEDQAAMNFLAVDPGLERLLGRDLAGSATLYQVLPALSRAGVSVLVAAGAGAAALACADRLLLLRSFRPRSAPRRWRRHAPSLEHRPCQVPPRRLCDRTDRLLGPRHFLDVDCDDPERPRVAGTVLDLGLCELQGDPALARGAVLAAAWCCRLADGDCDLSELGRRYAAFTARDGACALDPFHTAATAVPPWPLVVAVLERLPGLRLRCTRPPR